MLIQLFIESRIAFIIYRWFAFASFCLGLSTEKARISYGAMIREREIERNKTEGKETEEKRRNTKARETKNWQWKIYLFTGTQRFTKILHEGASGYEIGHERFGYQPRLFVQHDDCDECESVQQPDSLDRGEKGDSFRQQCHRLQ